MTTTTDRTVTKGLHSMGIINRGLYWVINDRYEVNKMTGGVIDFSTEKFAVIPSSIYGIRDRLIKQNEGVTA